MQSDGRKHTKRESMNNLFRSPKEALEGVIRDGMLLAVGGFGLCGIPEKLLEAFSDTGARDLTVASNNAGVDGWGGSASGNTADSQNDLQLRRRER